MSWDLQHGTFPKMYRIRQNFDVQSIDDVQSAVKEQLRREDVQAQLASASTIGIGVGSRGIIRLTEVVKSLIDELVRMGKKPVLIPAMGSHGGATAEGQEAILAKYGFSPETMGVPVAPSMDVVLLGETPSGVPVYFSKAAMDCDAVIPVNRVKCHTTFRAELESGVGKMLAIGFGKHKGAISLHHYGFQNFHWVLPEAIRLILERAPVALGLAVVENAREQLNHVQVVIPSEWEEQEKALLRQSRQVMAGIPFTKLDVLLVDEMGKNISGQGMDPNITGRFSSFVELPENDPATLKTQRIVVRDLTPESHGNAAGVGLADLITKKLADQIDYPSTYENVITSTNLESARTPLVMTNDREAIAVALRTCLRLDTPEKGRLVHIKNTLELEEMDVSAALLPEVESNPRLEVVKALGTLSFDDDGNLRG